MKKAILILTLLTHTYASDLINKYTNGDYKSAYELAVSQCNVNCNDKNLNLILGNSAFKLGKYDEALSAYDRVLIIDKDNIEARLQSAMIYQKNGNLTLLKAELQNLENNPKLTKEEKAAVKNTLSQLIKDENNEKEKNKIYGSVGIGLGYESNPKKVNLNDTTLHIGHELLPYFNIPGEKREPATSVLANVNAGYKNQVNDIYDFDIGANFYNRYYIKSREEDFQDLNIFSLSFSNGFAISKNFKTNILLSYDYIWLKHKRYLNTLTFDISGDINFNDNFSHTIGYSIGSNDYIDSEDKIRGSYHHTLYSMSKIIMQRSLVYLKLAYDLEKNKKNKEVKSEDYKEYSISIGMAYLYNSQIILRANATYGKSYYKEKVFADKRRDTEFKVNLGAEYDMDHHNIFSLNLGYSKVNSTIGINSYNNYFTNFMYKYKF